MFRALVILSLCLTAGCSMYDVTNRTADMLLEGLLGPNDKYDRNKNGKDHEPVFWDRDVSRCIQSEIKAQTLDEQLVEMFDAVEAGKDYVVLPNGERYLVGNGSVDIETRSPTADCIDRYSD